MSVLPGWLLRIRHFIKLEVINQAHVPFETIGSTHVLLAHSIGTQETRLKKLVKN